ncbi:MAG: hypothetical protein ACI37R_00720 [Candidatus Avigastranaerophilus sp.]
MDTEKEKLKLLGRNIAKYRKNLGYSQNKFVEIINISREHLAKNRNRKKKIKSEIIIQDC